MDVGLDQDIDTTDAVEFDLLIFIVSPITHAGHVCPAGVIFFVPLGKNDISVQGSGQFAALVGFNPRVVVKATFNVAALVVAMEPDI